MNDQVTQQVVQIDETLPIERLRQDEEKDGAEHRSNWGQWRNDEP